MYCNWKSISHMVSTFKEPLTLEGIDKVSENLSASSFKRANRYVPFSAKSISLVSPFEEGSAIN